MSSLQGLRRLKGRHEGLRGLRGSQEIKRGVLSCGFQRFKKDVTGIQGGATRRQSGGPNLGLPLCVDQAFQEEDVLHTWRHLLK